MSKHKKPEVHEQHELKPADVIDRADVEVIIRLAQERLQSHREMFRVRYGNEAASAIDEACASLADVVPQHAALQVESE